MAPGRTSCQTPGVLNLRFSMSKSRPLPAVFPGSILVRIACAALAASISTSATAATLTDNFNVHHDYLAQGIAGTIWDGVYFGAGEFANTAFGGSGAGLTLQCEANSPTPDTLTVRSSATDWEFGDDDGFFLYKVVRGDFSAVVRIVRPFETGSYNTAGLMARAFSSGGNPFGGSEDWVSWTRFDQFNIGNYFRNAVNGETERRTKSPSNNYWLRLDRSGNTFTVYERANAGDPWILMDTQVRVDFAGQPLQVGILHATFDVERLARFSDFSITATNFDSFAPEPDPATSLSLAAGTNRNVDISWTPGLGSSGSLVALWTGSSVLKQRPADGFTYVGSSNFGAGDLLLATNYYVVYAGSETNVTVTNLPAGASCHVAVFSYAGSGDATTYSRTPAIGSFIASGQPRAPGGYITLQVDPEGPALTNYTSLGEWNTDGNFGGWATAQVSNAVVSGGVLTGTASGSDSQLTRFSMAGGPDLDLGFNDYLDIRLQVPADYSGDVLIHYGTTATPGIGGTRVLTIPAAQIPKDGAFHVYRFDLGLEVYWRSFLRDLRIDPLDSTGAGKTFAIDYIRVGDLTGDVYLPRYTTSNPQPGQLHELGRPVIEMVSKHFRFLWDTNVATQNGWTANTPRGTLRNLEDTWQFYVKVLGYREPAESWNPANRNGNKYKINMSTWHSGYWAGNEVPGSTAQGRLNITPDGLRVDPPTWVVPHELMHVFQFHQRDGGQTVHGSWSEGHANYGRELWLNFYRDFFPNNERSGIDANYIHSAHMIVAHGRDYYLSWPFFMYLDENPDGLPDLGFGTVANIWKNNLPGVYPYNTLESMTPVSTLKDIIGYFARRQLTFDYQNQAAITNALNGQDPLVWRRFHLTELVRRSDDTNWWRVPMEMAPMQGAYTLHELVPHGAGDGRVVAVNFRGLPDAARGADWRASLIALSDSGEERYTPLWNSGSNSITLAANENHVYLSVAGTPDTILAHEFNDLTHPYRSHGSKQRFHYELQVFGATPKESDNGGTAGLVQHPNGGGWRSATATVDSTAYIGPNARVLGNAQVRNFARIEDFAVVRDSAQVRENAVVSGHALIRNNAQVRQNAKVRDWAIVSGSAVITGNARVLERAQVTGGTVTDSGVAKGSAIFQGGTISGWGIVDGDFMASRNVSNGVAFGHLPFTGVPDDWVRPLPDHLYARYEFNAAHDSMVRDETGVTDGYLIGNPTWSGFFSGRGGVLSFNGVDQCVALDKSLSDLKDITVAAWVRWLGGAPNQPVWFFGAGNDRCMFLTPDDGEGRLKFVIRNGGPDQTLIGPAALDTGVWTHVAVTLSGNAVGRLYVNGVLQQEAPITIAPEQLNAPNTANTPQQNYLARGADVSQPFFNGAIDSVRIYSRALTESEIAALGPANTPPTLAPMSDRVGHVGVPIVITNSASDGGLPWETLTFSLPSAPLGATIDPVTGVFVWRPGTGHANTTNLVQVRVTDNGAPNLSATQTFFITVAPLARPAVNVASAPGEPFALHITGDAGPDYSIQTSTNLFDWTTVFTTNSPPLPFSWVDPDPGGNLLFYRILLGPAE